MLAQVHCPSDACYGLAVCGSTTCEANAVHFVRTPAQARPSWDGLTSCRSAADARVAESARAGTGKHHRYTFDMLVLAVNVLAAKVLLVIVFRYDAAYVQVTMYVLVIV